MFTDENMHIQNGCMFSGTQNRSQKWRSLSSWIPEVSTSTLCAFTLPSDIQYCLFHFEDLFRADTAVDDMIIPYLSLVMLYFILEPMFLHMALVYLFVSEHKVVRYDITFCTEQNSTNSVYELSHLTLFL